MLPRLPLLTLFPYTTLFRSLTPAPRRAGPTRPRGLATRIVVGALLVVVTVAFVYPFVWLVSASLKPRSDVFDNRLIPERSEEHTSELQSRRDLVCRLLLEKK